MMRTIACALVVAAISPAAAPAEVIGDWTVEVSTDRLDPKQKSVSAHVLAPQPISQFGRDVGARLVVRCVEIPGDARRLGWLVRFSEAVSIGQRFIRWRLDDGKIDSRYERPYSDGKVFYLYTFRGPDPVVTGLRSNAKLLKVEASLPWAGNVLLEFPVSGGKDALAKVPCAGTAPKAF